MNRHVAGEFVNEVNEVNEVGRPKLLDLFCGAGGAGMGYSRAGFSVVGVDIEPQPNYPFEFHQADALTYPLDGFDVIHASPPCQRYSRASSCRPGLAAKYPDLIPPVRRMLQAAGLPYVIENVEGAPLLDPVMLCGSMFGLQAQFPPHGTVGLQRHRLFESNVPLVAPGSCRHELPALRVFGHGRPGNSGLTGPGYAKASRDVMGIGWMSRDELNESIPPAYAEHVGRQLWSAARKPEKTNPNNIRVTQGHAHGTGSKTPGREAAMTVPGVYAIPEAEYFASPALSCSGAKLLLPPSCPALFKYRQDHPEHKDVFDLGSAAHKEVLGAGPELAILDFGSWQTKASRQARDEAYAAGKTPILKDAYLKVRAMAEAIRRHPKAGPLLSAGNGGKAEQSLFWADEETGVPRRCRIDWLPEPGAGQYVIADYKTCERADPASVARAVTNYGYLQQEQWYLDGVRALGLSDNPDFWFIFQEKTPPYLVSIARVKDEDRWIGQARNRQAIERFRECSERDEWPGYEGGTDNGITDITLPPWAARDLEVSV